MKKIEFMYFEGCPSYKQSLKNLKEALIELDINEAVKLINVKSPEQAKELSFYGSPTIKIDGLDLEGRKRDFSYSCRLYNIAGKLIGVPTKDYIREKLQLRL